ncbi:hypothetical protein WA1_46350 [Scytonema hofmannii PCC 7110]|uniref:Uncharacterized protein n=1 Tax=Scytonema hofmannii PCC 7110 TaxID=128403 RepID=A0A139WXC8_9CYAN|nr:COP23 domain-containing protein [Scytonema hofmannii]KYC37063.1 hypothetical protein WA1_46350 [Scytonema hofmannii PCC 7110]
MNKYILLTSVSIFSAISLTISSCNNNLLGSSVAESEQPTIVSSSQLSKIEASPDPPTETAEKTQFTCGTTFNEQLKQKVPTTIAWKSSDKRAIVQWVKPMDNYWTPEKRCNEVSRRMQEADEAGTLKFLTNGKMNGQKVICTAIEVNGDCKNLVMTLRPQDKALLFLTELKDIFNGRSAGPIQHNSGETQIYIEIDLKEIWKNAPRLE